MPDPLTCVNFNFWILQSSAILLLAAKTTEMKKLLLTLILMSVLPATLRSDDDIARKIDLLSVEITTRSFASSPEASIYKDILSISFDASGICSFYIEDSFGATVYSGAFPANGMEYRYDLEGIGDGLLHLVIKGHNGEYEGYFNL